MLLLLTLACQSATPSWDLFTPTKVEAPAPAPAPAPVEAAPAPAEEAPAPAPAEEAPVDPVFQEALDLAAKAEDPWGTEPAADVAPEPAPAATAGLASQPAWGLRVVATVPAAQPPRAVLGLPSGEEVVVSPGSMLPEVGVLVVAIGQGAVQIARVTPAGDHATIESQSLLAQY